MYCQPVFFSLVVIMVCMSLLRFALYIILLGILLPLEWRDKIPNLFFQLFNGDSNGFECTSRIHKNVLARSLVSFTRLVSDKLPHTLLDMAISGSLTRLVSDKLLHTLLDMAISGIVWQLMVSLKEVLAAVCTVGRPWVCLTHTNGMQTSGHLEKEDF